MGFGMGDFLKAVSGGGGGVPQQISQAVGGGMPQMPDLNPQAFADAISKGLNPQAFADAISKGLNPQAFADAISKGVGGATSQFGDILKQAAAGSTDALNSIKQMVGDTSKTMTDQLGRVTDVFGNVIGNATSTFSNIGQNVTKGIGDLTSGVKEGLGDLSTKLHDISGGFTNMADAIRGPSFAQSMLTGGQGGQIGMDTFLSNYKKISNMGGFDPLDPFGVLSATDPTQLLNRGMKAGSSAAGKANEGYGAGGAPFVPQDFKDITAMGQGLQQQAMPQMGNLVNALAGQAAGDETAPGQILARNALKQATEQNIAGAQSAMASQRGINPALAARMTGQNLANINQQAAMQGANMAAQQQLNAQQQLGGLLGQNLATGAGALGTAGHLQNAQNQLMSQAALQAQGINEDYAKAKLQGMTGLLGGAAQGIGSGLMAGGLPKLAAAAMSKGGKVPGQAKVKGDSPKNDTVTAKLSPGEIVIPRSHASSPEKAMQFLSALKNWGEPAQDYGAVAQLRGMADRIAPAFYDGGQAPDPYDPKTMTINEAFHKDAKGNVVSDSGGLVNADEPMKSVMDLKKEQVGQQGEKDSVLQTKASEKSAAELANENIFNRFNPQTGEWEMGPSLKASMTPFEQAKAMELRQQVTRPANKSVEKKPIYQDPANPWGQDDSMMHVQDMEDVKPEPNMTGANTGQPAVGTAPAAPKSTMKEPKFQVLIDPNSYIKEPQANPNTAPIERTIPAQQQAAPKAESAGEKMVGPSAAMDTMAEIKKLYGQQDQPVNFQTPEEMAAKQAKDLQEIQAKNAQHLQAIDMQNDKLAEDIKNAKVDPTRLWTDMKAGNKALAVIGLIMGGIGSGLTKMPNQALAIFQQAMEQDLAAQKATLDSKNTLYSNNLKRYDNDSMASYRTLMELNSGLRSQIELKIAQTRNVTAQADLRRTQAALLQIYLSTKNALGQLLLKHDIATGNMELTAPLLEYMPEYKKQVVKLRDGSLSLATTPESAKTTQATLGSLDKIWDSTANVQKIMQDPSLLKAIPFNEKHGQAKAATEGLLLEINKLENLGRFTHEEANIFRQMVPDATDIFTATGFGQLNELKRAIRSKYIRTMKSDLLRPVDLNAHPNAIPGGAAQDALQLQRLQK